MFHRAHPPLLHKGAPADLASLHARQKVALHLAARAVAEGRERGAVTAEDEAHIAIGAYLIHMDATEDRDARAPATEAQLLTLIRAASAEFRLAYIELMCLDPLEVDDDLALLVALADADLHSLIDHKDATGQLLVVRERIYGQPETPGEMGE